MFFRAWRSCQPPKHCADNEPQSHERENNREQFAGRDRDIAVDRRHFVELAQHRGNTARNAPSVNNEQLRAGCGVYVESLLLRLMIRTMTRPLVRILIVLQALQLCAAAANNNVVNLSHYDLMRVDFARMPSWA